MTPIEELTAIARFAGVQHVLDIAREMLPASDYDELVGRVKEASRQRLRASMTVVETADEIVRETFMAGDDRDFPAA